MWMHDGVPLSKNIAVSVCPLEITEGLTELIQGGRHPKVQALRRMCRWLFMGFAVVFSHAYDVLVLLFSRRVLVC